MTAPSRFELYLPGSPRAAEGWRLEEIREPARLFGANGIRLHADGRLWITELVGEQISAWDAETDTMSVESPMGSLLLGPDDLAFDSEGTVYVSETMNSRISGRRADGTYFVLVDDCPAVNGITVDPATDRLYVDEMREGGRVLEVDRHQPNTVRVIAEGLDWLNALEVGPDGRLYLPQVFAGTVLAVHPDTGAVETVVEGLASPTAVKFAPDGRLVVSQASIGEVTAVDLATGERSCLLTASTGIDNFSMDADGHIYVSNFVEASVQRFSMATGEVDKVLSAGSFLGPYQVASGRGGLLAADQGSICRITEDGEIVRISRLLLDQPFVAVGVADVDGHVVALTQGGEVNRRDADTGEWIKVLGRLSGATDEYFAADPNGFSAIGASGTDILSGLRGGDIVVFGLDGTVKDQYPSGLETISAITTDGATIVASDEINGKVQVRTGATVEVLDGFTRPHGVALTPELVLVADQGERQLVGIDRSTGVRTVLAEQLPFGLPAFKATDGRRTSVTIAVDGTIVLGCDGDGSVRRLVRD